MDNLLPKLLELVGDPVLVVVAVGLGLLWRMFAKQNEFIKERLDMLRQENSELRSQLKEFKEENARLRSTTGELASLSADLQKQPLLSEQTTRKLSLMAHATSEISLLVERTERLLGFNEEVREASERALATLENGFLELGSATNESARMLYSGIREVQAIVSHKERTNKEISLVLNELIQILEDSQTVKASRFLEVQEKARQLLSR